MSAQKRAEFSGGYYNKHVLRLMPSQFGLTFQDVPFQEIITTAPYKEAVTEVMLLLHDDMSQWSWYYLAELARHLPNISTLKIYKRILRGDNTHSAYDKNQVLKYIKAFFSNLKSLDELVLYSVFDASEKAKTHPVVTLDREIYNAFRSIPHLKTLRIEGAGSAGMWLDNFTSLVSNLPNTLIELDFSELTLDCKYGFSCTNNYQLEQLKSAFKSMSSHLKTVSFPYAHDDSLDQYVELVRTCLNEGVINLGIKISNSFDNNPTALHRLYQLLLSKTLNTFELGSVQYSFHHKMSYRSWAGLCQMLGLMRIKELKISNQLLYELNIEYLSCFAENLSKQRAITALTLNRFCEIDANQASLLSAAFANLESVTTLTLKECSLTRMTHGNAIGSTLHAFKNLKKVIFHEVMYWHANENDAQEFQAMCAALPALEDVVFNRMFTSCSSSTKTEVMSCIVNGISTLKSLETLRFSDDSEVGNLNETQLRQLLAVFMYLPNLKRVELGLQVGGGKLWPSADIRWQILYDAIVAAPNIQALIDDEVLLPYKDHIPYIAKILDLLRQRQFGTISTIALHKPQERQAIAPRMSAELIPLDQVQLDKPIGKGAFGEVYRGEYGGDPVAVKMLGSETVQSQQKFMAEIHILAQLRHPRIVNLYGYCKQGESFMLVMALVERGSLYNLLHKEKIDLPQSLKLKFALDVALGIQYLHKRNPTILHLDLKPGNILATNDLRLKLADFGLSKALASGSQAYTNQVAGTMAYMAPELFSGTKYSAACDIYSLAIVIWEIYHRAIPHTDLPHIGMLIGKVMGGGRPSIDSTKMPTHGQLVTKMWRQEPKERIEIDDVVASLTQSMQQA